MLIIEVVSPVRTRHVDTRDKSFDIRYQEADLHMTGGRPRPTEVRPPRNGEYQPGFYTLAPESFTTDLYDRLELRYVNLIPLADAVTTAEEMLSRAKKALKR